jgi:ATP-dependent Clp protease protease subunit
MLFLKGDKMRNLIIAILLLASTPTYAHVPLSLPRDIYMYGAIDEKMERLVDTQIALLNSLNSEPITIHITSPGGDVLSGLQIYDNMQESVAPIRTICEGYCMSMAAVLLTSGTVRESQASATIMFHEVSTESKGKISVIIMDVMEAQRLQNIIDAHISEHTGLSLDAVHKMESYDHYMGAEEAKSLGVITKIRGKHGK